MILSQEGPVNADTPLMHWGIFWFFKDIVQPKKEGGREGYHSAFLVAHVTQKKD
jgi:hypothetical protein